MRHKTFNELWPDLAQMDAESWRLLFITTLIASVVGLKILS